MLERDCRLAIKQHLALSDKARKEMETMDPMSQEFYFALRRLIRESCHAKNAIVDHHQSFGGGMYISVYEEGLKADNT